MIDNNLTGYSEYSDPVGHARPSNCARAHNVSRSPTRRARPLPARNHRKQYSPLKFGLEKAQNVHFLSCQGIEIQNYNENINTT